MDMDVQRRFELKFLDPALESAALSELGVSDLGGGGGGRGGSPAVHDLTSGSSTREFIYPASVWTQGYHSLYEWYRSVESEHFPDPTGHMERIDQWNFGMIKSNLFHLCKYDRSFKDIRVCTWTTLMLFILAIFNVCVIANRFTGIAGETFGMLISVLFIQEAIKGLVSEFTIPKNEDPNKVKYQFQWLYTNGILAVVFSFGLLYTTLKSRKVRSWWFGTDYGVPLMVIVWTAVSFSVPSKLPCGVPRILFSPLLWESESTYHWTVIKLAQQKEFNLKNPSAYHYDILLLGFMFIRKKLVTSAKESIKQKASNSEIYNKMQTVFIEIDSPPITTTIVRELKDLQEAVMKVEDGEENTKGKFDLEEHIDAHLPVLIMGKPEYGSTVHVITCHPRPVDSSPVHQVANQ
ncbi:unnamed protein product [Lactuca virosa]|uniref:Bicarbonate transporter-like transmembrane domain-containing protein n=1 Tax=Lactuca virosa TaxID=75947 RepID=A0AAU9PBZ4_9ASTR|nr:unnamed protein product [Lactuca virosa]